MKRTDLVKNLGLKIRGQMQHAAVPGRFAQGSTALPDRKEQRKLDHAAGLVPFAIKLHGELVRQLREQAEGEGISLQDLADRLIRAGLGAQAPVAASEEAPESKAAAKKAAAKTAVAKKAVAKKAAATKAAETKAATTKAPAKKVAAKTAATRRAPAKKTVKPKA